LLRCTAYTPSKHRLLFHLAHYDWTETNEIKTEKSQNKIYMLYIDCKVFFCKSYKREQRKSASGKILQKKFASLVVVNNETVTFYCNKSIQV